MLIHPKDIIYVANQPMANIDWRFEIFSAVFCLMRRHIGARPIGIELLHFLFPAHFFS